MAEILKKTELALQYGERPLHLDIKSNIGTEKAPRSHGKVEFSRFTKFDGIVLTFDGYIRDDIPDGVRGPALGVHDPRAKEYTIRNVVIRYFMEDGTLSIVEVPTYDSGLIAAPIIKRQMVKKAYGSNADGLQNSEGSSYKIKFI